MSNPDANLSPEQEQILEHLEMLYSHRNDGSPTQYLAPHAAAAARWIRELLAEREAQSVRIGWLTMEVEKMRGAFAARAALNGQPFAEGIPFPRGARVRKTKGLPFGNGSASVLCSYQTTRGEWRVVVEHMEGWQHIFSPDQFALSEQPS